MNTAFVFSGQGAQKVGMGKNLYDNNKAAADIFNRADQALGWSISEICFEGPEEKLTASKNCQPAIYTVSIAALAAFLDLNPAIKPVGCGGLSLGEYAALNAAGVFSFEDGLKIIEKRGQLMDEACQETNGGMASVLGGDENIINAVCEECGIDVANYNCPGQIVISGEKDKLSQAITLLKEKGLRKVIPLKVAGAYHSRLMKNAGEKFQEIISRVNINSSVHPVVQNFTGKTTDEIEEIRVNLVKQVDGSVRWVNCVKSLIQLGADTIIEFGPGNVLTGLAKRIESSLNTANIQTMEDIENFKL